MKVGDTSHGILQSINVSPGGVPKTPRAAAHVRAGGLEGDRQDDLRFHGGPDRAVCLYSFDLIEALRGEGHPIDPGSIGENLTIAGVDWTLMRAGTRVEIGEVAIEVTAATSPCSKIAGSFSGREFTRVSQNVYPGWSRFYGRVVQEGVVQVGDKVVVRGPDLLF
jgi:MOSC domain-containing protein YiiM